MVDSSTKLLNEDLDRWPELLGYQVHDSASVEEKLALREQHATELVGRQATLSSKFSDIAKYALRIADFLEHVNKKTEGRVCEIQQALSQEVRSLKDSLDSSYAGVLLETVVKLQFQDIHRQELEAVVESLRMFADFFEGASKVDITEAMWMLPEIMARFDPRMDIDAVDMDPEIAGSNVELF